MMKLNWKQGGLCLLFVWITPLWAKSIGEISTDLLGPASTLADLAYKTCYIIGFGFLVSAGIRYRSYRRNPVQVRFGEVLALLFFSLLLILLPFFVQYSEGAVILQSYSPF